MQIQTPLIFLVSKGESYAVKRFRHNGNGITRIGYFGNDFIHQFYYLLQNSGVVMKEFDAYLATLAMNLEVTGYHKQSMDEVFCNWLQNPQEKRSAIYTSLKNHPTGQRLYLEIMLNYSEQDLSYKI